MIDHDVDARMSDQSSNNGSSESSSKTVDRAEIINLGEDGYPKGCYVVGSCVLPDGGFVIAEYNNKVLKRFNRTNIIVDHCDFMGLDMNGLCFIADGKMLAVATGKNNTVEIVSFGGGMKRIRSIKMDHHCRGVTYCNGMLYVTASKGQQIHEYQLGDGQLKRTFCPVDAEGQTRFEDTRYITVSKDNMKLIMTDHEKGLFILDIKTGNVLHEVNFDGDTVDVCVGEEDDVFVSTWYPEAVFHVGLDGKIISKLGTKERMGRCGPECISYHRDTARLAVMADRMKDHMYVFHLK